MTGPHQSVESGPPWGGVPGMSHQGEDPGHAAGTMLGTPHNPRKKLEEVAGERKV